MPATARTPIPTDISDTAAALAAIHTETGTSLLALTEASPVLLIFLRHFGCPFGRKTIGDIATLRPTFAARNVRPVFVHLAEPDLAAHYFNHYAIPDIDRISDPTAAIYRSPLFALPQQDPIRDLFKPAVWLGWLKHGTLFKQGMGKFEGDGTQMPGIFFLRDAQIVRSFRHRNISDDPDYLALIR